jgi:hypothetical protein
MNLKEFESYCDILIKEQIESKPKFKKSQDAAYEKTIWANDSRIKLINSFTELSKHVDGIDAGLVKKTIDKKIQYFLNRFL